MRPSLLILPFLLLMTQSPTQARSRLTLKHQRALPARPNLAQVYAPGTTHGLVFKTFGALSLYCHDTVTVGQPLSLQTYIDEGAAILSPNGTRIEILTPLLSIRDVGARYVKIRMAEGYWKGKEGYILWSEVAALPPPTKRPKK